MEVLKISLENEAEIVERADRTMTGAFWYGIDLKPLSIDHKIQKEEERLTVGTGEVVCVFTPGHRRTFSHGTKIC